MGGAEKAKALSFPVLRPSLQVAFYYRLQEIRNLYLQEALRQTVESIDISSLDAELVALVDNHSLQKVASFGVRGEVFFPIPRILMANPFLLGYYRLLFGLSQKEFYNKGPFGLFKRFEDRGEISKKAEELVPALCTSLIATGQMLVDGLDDLSLTVVHNLQMLTLGPQLRGSQNTKLGQSATKEIFDLVLGLAQRYVKEATDRTIRIVNDSHRTVMIEFFSDPDVRIMEKLETQVRPLVSMEIKGGTDSSNIHNRLGEAEKSHQKAKNLGFFEFWTIVRVDIDDLVARRESPTTSHFFHLDYIKDISTPQHQRFRELLNSLIGIRS